MTVCPTRHHGTPRRMRPMRVPIILAYPPGYDAVVARQLVGAKIRNRLQLHGMGEMHFPGYQFWEKCLAFVRKILDHGVHACLVVHVGDNLLRNLLHNLITLILLTRHASKEIPKILDHPLGNIVVSLVPLVGGVRSASPMLPGSRGLIFILSYFDKAKVIVPAKSPNDAAWVA